MSYNSLYKGTGRVNDTGERMQGKRRGWPEPSDIRSEDSWEPSVWKEVAMGGGGEQRSTLLSTPPSHLPTCANQKPEVMGPQGQPGEAGQGTSQSIGLLLYLYHLLGVRRCLILILI